jgi:predicted Zn-dependent protease
MAAKAAPRAAFSLPKIVLNKIRESASTPADLADITEQARRLVQADDFAHAESLLLQALAANEHTPGRADALYTLAVARRYSGRLKESLETLDQLLELQPGYGRAWQERGHALLTQGRVAAAREAFEQAVRLNPALPASWNKLARLYLETGQYRRSEAAGREFESLQALPRELLSVTSMIHEKRYLKAERLCRRYLQEHPHQVEAMRLLAVIGSDLGVLSDAEFLLESCSEFDPGNVRVQYDLANLLLKMQKFQKAYELTEVLVDSDRDNLAFLSLKANAAAGLGRQEEAIRLYDRVLRASPQQVAIRVMRGHACKTVGKLDEAVSCYHEACRIKPDHGDAWWSLANTKTYRFRDDEMHRMREQESSSGTSREDRIHFCFALGKALEDREEFAESFKYYARGNALKAETTGHSSTHLDIRTQAQISACSTELFERDIPGCPAPDPIFIVGLPRAGSTLLEQILSSHPLVDGTHELPNVIALAHRLRGGSYGLEAEPGDVPRYPHNLKKLDADYFRRFGEQYIEQTRVFRQGAPLFIDKNPNNFFHIGLIRLMLPNAKVIDARRHPMSCCFSGFKQLFGQGQEFSYGLESLGNYYREYVELMNHWDRVLPGYVLRVQYEDVVADLETQVRRVLDFCSLPFDEACLAFHQTERSVRTPSSEQVRQPIYRSGLEQWRNYEPWLGPLKMSLGPEILQDHGMEL